MRDITKRFGSVVANDRVWLDIYRGEILALLGENGSGKTTLMNMLSGIYFPDEGQILIDGEEVVIRSPRDAYRYGIGMIHQHFKLVDVFTAAENITLGLDEKLDLKATAARIRSICERYGFDLDPNQKIYDMSVSQKQTVEIVKRRTSSSPSCAACATTARPSSSSRTRCTRSRRSATAWPCCATASSWATCSPKTPTRRK